VLFAALMLCSGHSGADGGRRLVAAPSDDGVTTGMSWITPERFPVGNASWR